MKLVDIIYVFIGILVVYKYRYKVLYKVSKKIINIYSYFYNYTNNGLRIIEIKTIRNNLHVHKLKYNGENVYIFNKNRNHSFEHDKLKDEIDKIREMKILLCILYDDDKEYDVTNNLNDFIYHFNKEDNFTYFLEYMCFERDIKNIDNILLITSDLDEKKFLIDDIIEKNFKELLHW